MITSASNDKIKEIKKLIKSASRRKETGLYIVEGIRMVREIPADAVKTLYVAESMTDKFTDICNQIPAEVEIVRDSVFQSMPDTPQRIATDTSQKLSIRYGETIKAYEKSSTLQTSDLKMIPLVFAGWLRNGIRNWQKKKNRLDFWYCPLSVLEMHSTLKREDFLTTYLC